MNVSIEQALSIFSKWAEEKSTVRLLFTFFSAGGMFTGTVFRVTTSEVVMIPLGDDTLHTDSSFVSVSFIMAESFAFIDPRDAGADAGLVSKEMEFGIFVRFASGERCTWALVPE